MSNKASQYQKKTPREHVLLRPDTYIGDIEKTTDEMYICNDDNSIVKKKITYVPGLLKIFDELLVNSRDAGTNDKTCNTIKININNEDGSITVWNNGQDGIPVEEHPEHKMLVPSMIFGELLTSSNYDDDQKRTTGGRNGYGSKLANIFSTQFTVEVGDSKNQKKFIQSWYDNMSRFDKAKVTKYSQKNSYVKVTVYPDFEKLHLKKEDVFNVNKMTDHQKLFKRRCHDIAGTSGLSDKKSSESMKIYFNDIKLDTSNFKKYIETYFKDDTIYYDDSSKRWEVGVLYRPDSGFEVISFVNGISTYNGGTHVNHVVDQIIKNLINDHIMKKNKDIKINSSLVKENLTFFVNCIVENPAFSSQTKDTLVTKTNKFGSTYKAHDAFLKKISKSGIVDQVVKLAAFKETAGLKKTDGKKQIKLKGIPKLEDANKAGTKESSKCSLILTEGDSAKAFAMAGMGVVGKDYFGVFPLKGKLLNVREASAKVLSANDEINYLKQIIGLKQNTDYSLEENFNQLRYGRVIILTDQDYDGSHIKGLVMNFFHVIWPELIKRENFITSLATPIVKLFKGNHSEIFYNITEYEDYVEDLKEKNEIHLWKTKYYKGLGTSTSSEAKEYFHGIEDKLIKYFFQSTLENAIKNNTEEQGEPEEPKEPEEPEGPEGEPEEPEEQGEPYEESEESVIKTVLTNDDNDAILLAFDKSRSDDRKIWLKQYDKNMILTYDQKDISYSEFIHKDLIHFSNDDTSRSIPSVIDGFKPSQRKIYFGASLRGLDKVEVKVAQLAGFVSDKAAYHHGEMSLNGAIIGMAQDFIGSNNINVLKPNGQFGSRLRGGKDAASPRYIWTEFTQITSLVFRKEDDPILKYQDEDGMRIEPNYYLPIIPIVLINGAEGIGTGFSTKCPQYNPIDIINIIMRKLNNECSQKDYEELIPWYSLFEGTVEQDEVEKKTYNIKGKYEIRDNHLIVSELPIGEWTTNYKEFLEKQLESESLKKNKININFLNYTDNNTDKKVYFDLEFKKGFLQNTSPELLIKSYHLTKRISTTNIHLYNKNGTIRKYSNIGQIIEEFYDHRLESYIERKNFIINKLESELKLISYKAKFILAVIEKEIKINNKTKDKIESKLVNQSYPKMTNGIENENGNYNYLLGMNLWSLTYEKVEELKKQEEDKQSQLKLLKNKKVEDIWKEELEELLNVYEKWYIEKKKINDDSFGVLKKTKSTKNKKFNK